jgi:hypothetical protein
LKAILGDQAVKPGDQESEQVSVVEQGVKGRSGARLREALGERLRGVRLLRRRND